LVVVDDTSGAFAAIAGGRAATARRAARRAARRTDRGGRGVAAGGLFGGAIARPQGYDVIRDLTAAGFKPVRQLAEKDGFRFIEGLRPSTFAEASADKS
jgi:hypothetical protein